MTGYDILVAALGGASAALIFRAGFYYGRAYQVRENGSYIKYLIAKIEQAQDKKEKVV